MIRKISTTLLKDLLRPVTLLASKNIQRSGFNVPLVYASLARFSTITPKLKQQNEENTAEEFLLTEQNSQNSSIDFQAALAQYPFVHIPIYAIRNPSKMKTTEQIKKHIIAFKTLTCLPKDLPLAINILFQDRDIDATNGQEVFDSFYQPKIGEYIKQINQGAGTLRQRLHLMNVLNNMSKQSLQPEVVKTLDERSIVKQDETGALAAYYTHFVIKNQRDYTHLIDLLIKKMQQKDNPNKLYIAGTIITTPRFQQSYPEKLIDLALETYIENIPKMHNYQILFSLRHIYKYQSQSSRRYCEALKNHLMRVHLQEGNIDFHVPLIIKTIKYCSKNRINCNQLVSFISNNIQRFKIIFTNKNISKGVLFSLIFEKTNPKLISQEVKGYLVDYFKNGVKELTQAEQVQENQLIRFSKLYIQFSEQLSESDKRTIREAYLNHIIPNFNHSSQVLFYSLLVALRDRLPKAQGATSSEPEKEVQKIKKYIVQYLNSCSSTQNKESVITKNINSAVQIYYQIGRHELQFRKGELPRLLKYNFAAQQTVESETISLFLSYLNGARQPKQLIHSVLTQLQPQIELFFKKKKIRSIQTVYCLLSVCDKVNFDHKYLFKHVENFIGAFINDRPNFFIPQRDVRFINDKMLKRGYGSANLKQFILGVLDNPKNWPKLRAQYTQKENAFRERLASRSRQNSQRPSGGERNNNRYPRKRQ